MHTFKRYSCSVCFNDCTNYIFKKDANSISASSFTQLKELVHVNGKLSSQKYSCRDLNVKNETSKLLPALLQKQKNSLFYDNVVQHSFQQQGVPLKILKLEDHGLDDVATGPDKISSSRLVASRIVDRILFLNETDLLLAVTSTSDVEYWPINYFDKLLPNYATLHIPLCSKAFVQSIHPISSPTNERYLPTGYKLCLIGANQNVVFRACDILMKKAIQ
jgi:hypothetical protein